MDLRIASDRGMSLVQPSLGAYVPILEANGDECKDVSVLGGESLD
jgi:hypothetical protein